MITAVHVEKKISFNYQSWGFHVEASVDEGGSVEDTFVIAREVLHKQIKEYADIDPELDSCLDLAEVQTIEIAHQVRAKLKLPPRR